MGHDNDGDRSREARATLLRLLAEHARGAAMYGSGFSMQLPMGLIALCSVLARSFDDDRFRFAAAPALATG